MQHLQGLFCGIWLLFIAISAANIHRMLSYTSSRAARRACHWIEARSSVWHWAYVVFVNACLGWFFWFIHYYYVAVLVLANFSLLWINGVVLRNWHRQRAVRILFPGIERLFPPTRLLR